MSSFRESLAAVTGVNMCWDWGPHCPCN